MEPPNALSTETKLSLGKQKKDAGDQAFRQGDTKEGMYYISDLVLVTVKISAMKQYHEVTRLSNFFDVLPLCWFIGQALLYLVGIDK